MLNRGTENALNGPFLLIYPSISCKKAFGTSFSSSSQ